MNDRQAYALVHPLSRLDGSPLSLRPYCLDRRHATGVLLRSILAVDR